MGSSVLKNTHGRFSVFCNYFQKCSGKISDLFSKIWPCFLSSHHKRRSSRSVFQGTRILRHCSSHAHPDTRFLGDLCIGFPVVPWGLKEECATVRRFVANVSPSSKDTSMLNFRPESLTQELRSLCCGQTRPIV